MDSNSLITVIGIGYLLGSLPYGLILMKIFYGIDIRTIGSGNIGATNVLRSGNKLLALLTLFLDAFKGAIAILVVKYYLGLNSDYVAIAGLSAIMGHMYPVWLNFRGGKGVATFFGITLAFNPLIFVISGLTWLLSAFITRYSSLSALLAVIVFPVSCYFLDPSLLVISIVISIMILYKHTENIKRLMQGQETKINFKK
jgi:glycerol-3-phosphate acyltransferase PlsY